LSESSACDRSDTPRLLTIMGSGETAPTMVKVHRAILERLGPPPVPSVLLDTPFAFQENASELCERVRHYFAESLQAEIEVAGLAGGQDADSGNQALGRASEPDPFADERLISAVRRARYVFAGPGSPSYALRKWTGTVVPSLLSEMLRHGGGVTFSSAAALTLGVSTVPVYEVYKVGEDPHWLTGLDLLSVAGMGAAVIPHYNNAEGGTHDTRFCYLGEHRLAFLETELPENAFVLGVDEHTAITFDLDERVGRIAGLGVVTVRAAGRSRTFPTGETIRIDDILETAADLARGDRGVGGLASGRAGAGTEPEPEDKEGSAPTSSGSTSGASSPVAAGQVAAYTDSPLISLVREREASFSERVARRDMKGAVGQVLGLQDEITEWANDIPAGDAMDRARASFRSLIVELGRVGEAGVRDPRDVVGPFVEAMLELRTRARTERRFEDADWIRERLEGLGIEVRDSPDGSEWLLA
jgi:hypothetical protein